VYLAGATDSVALPMAELDAVVAKSTAAGFAGAARCDVLVVSIDYRTVGADGVTPALASGAVMMPGGTGCPGPYPLVAYSRGTDLEQTRAMATPGDGEATLVAALLAGQGFMVAATDYLGYARSDQPFHPYLHAGSEATANVDALRAARELAAQRNVPLDGKVFVTGYSQGGHAAMATQKLLQTSLPTEFTLAGAGHMAGPYDLVGSLTESVERLPVGELGSTYYVPFVVTSLQRVYGTLYATPSEFFESPYDETVETLFPTPAGVGLEELVRGGQLPLLLDSLVTDAFVNAARDPASPLRTALALNSPIDFAPQAPTLLCGGSRDPVVNFSNTERALAAFQGAGATAVSAFDVENEPAYSSLLRDDSLPVEVDTGYHATLVPPLCLLQVRQLFQTLR
jgi:pimeloyl-ACP methyl ester carboxylesterase